MNAISRLKQASELLGIDTRVGAKSGRFVAELHADGSVSITATRMTPDETFLLAGWLDLIQRDGTKEESLTSSLE